VVGFEGKEGVEGQEGGRRWEDESGMKGERGVADESRGARGYSR